MGYGIEALEEEGKEYYYHKDERNSTTYLSNERREIENRYAYDGYGRSQRKDEGVENAIRYTGQRYEGDGTNLYAYCRNNPIRYYDPSGYSGETNQTEKGHTTPEGEEGKIASAGTEGDLNLKYLTNM